MSTIPPVPAGDPTFSPNPDIDLDLNAAAAAYAADVGLNQLVGDLLATGANASDLLGGSQGPGMSRREFAQGFRIWQERLAGKNFDRRHD